jgi:hypothetical protein
MTPGMIIDLLALAAGIGAVLYARFGSEGSFPSLLGAIYASLVLGIVGWTLIAVSLLWLFGYAAPSWILAHINFG